MVLKTGSFKGMARDITGGDNKIIIFGAGVVGMTVTPEILKNYKLEERIECYIDNDKLRWLSEIDICNKKVMIQSPEILNKYESRVTILITITRFFKAYEQLKELAGNKNFSCYIIPAMCIRNFYSNDVKGVIKTSETPIIPKKLHYMWLGNKQMSENAIRCIKSWEKYCPDYEIIRWDESNYDVHKNKFVSQAYDNQRYAFVPDYARIEILYEYGGIYLDTDVELQRNLDELLYQNAFCSVEKWQILNFGGCSGSEKGYKGLEPFLDNWSKRTLIRTDGTIDNISSGFIDTTVAMKMGYRVNGKNQTINGINIYTYDYFHPYDYMSGKLEKTQDTFSIHQFNGGWLDDKTKEDNLKLIRLFDALMESAEIVDD